MSCRVNGENKQTINLAKMLKQYCRRYRGQ